MMDNIDALIKITTSPVVSSQIELSRWVVPDVTPPLVPNEMVGGQVMIEAVYPAD